MTIVADKYEYVVGVDTHARTHSYAITTSPSGTLLAQRTFPTTPAGLARAAEWIARCTDQDTAGTLISAEGTGSYGAQAAELLTRRGYRVVEAPTPDASRIRGKGKSDPADALAAARSVMSAGVDQLRDRRVGGPRAALQALVTRRDQLARARTREINQLIALLRTHDLGIDARAGITQDQIKAVARWRPRAGEAVAVALVREVAIDHASEILRHDQRLRLNEATVAALVKEVAPQLLTQYGVGPVNAAIILSVWSHPGRIRGASAWANMAGVAPIPVHSGNSHHYRLSRGGDRRLNRAIHSIMITRLRTPQTQDFIAERVRAGKSQADARRLLKYYIARQLFRFLNHTQPDPATPASGLLTAA